MSIEQLRDLLLWSTVINFGVLIVWFLAIVTARDAIHRLHGRWFPLTSEQFTAIHYLSMSLYKLGVILFNLVPYVALRLVT